jgi:hypothetical protein
MAHGVQLSDTTVQLVRRDSLRMPTKANQTVLSGFLCAVVILVGCSAKKPITSTAAPFRLESLNGDSLLLTPAIPEGHSNNAAVTLTLNSSMRPAAGTKCSAERGPFRLEQGKNGPDSIQITLPAPERWLSDLEGREEPDGSEDVEALYAILADLDQLQQKGCFADTEAPIRDLILQSLPMRPSESLFNAYGYRPERGALDLKPGMRLKIERAYFRTAEAGEEEHAAKNFLGVSTIYFAVALSSNSKTRFQQVGKIRYSPASLDRKVRDGSRDLGLNSVPEELHYRLLFYTYLVPKERVLSAVIIGASNASQLDGLDQQLRTLPDAGCKRATATSGVACFEFNGFVTLTSQINVELNGKLKFIDWGARIKDVLSQNSLTSLRIQRRYMNSYYDVRFDPADSNVFSLALVGGDRLSWSKIAPSTH